MQHTILIADSVNSCAMAAALYTHLCHEAKCGAASHSVEDTPSNDLTKHQHPHFRFLVSESFTLLYIRDLGAAGTNQYSGDFQAFACKVLERRLDELSANSADTTVHVIALAEQSTKNQGDKAQVLVLGLQAPPTDITVTGVSGMVYDWCHFSKPRYTRLQALKCTVLLLQHPGAPVYPYSGYAELYLSTSVLKAAGIPPKGELRKRIEAIVQTYMNAISLVYI